MRGTCNTLTRNDGTTYSQWKVTRKKSCDEEIRADWLSHNRRSKLVRQEIPVYLWALFAKKQLEGDHKDDV